MPANASEPLTFTTGDSPAVCLHGEWTLANHARLAAACESLKEGPVSGNTIRLDATGLGALDTAGAALLVRLLGAERLRELTPAAAGLSSEYQALLLAVTEAVIKQGPTEGGPGWRFGDGLALLGRRIVAGSRQVLQFVGFLGEALLTFLVLLPRPWRWRITALIAQMHQAGLNAVPIVVLLNFLVGAVVAFLGATVLRDFGATIYTVDLVAYAFMRELGVLLAAILLAGRTASAFTAQIGSMNLNEEIDALRVQGLNPMELLVLPRVLALLITLPLLAFVAMLSGMLGGAVVAVLTLDVSFVRFVAIVQEIPVRHVLLGLAKAPVFAVLIALIGCLEGFKVEGSAQSLGEHTTSAVVQSIFVVILLNAIAALFYMEMGW